MALKITPTFHCIGLEWSGSGGNSSTACTLKYRVQGTTTWKDGYDLVFDSRAIGGHTANEYRGSIVNLSPNTTYEIQLTAGAATISGTGTTWNENFPIASTTNVTSSSSTLSITTSGSASGYRLYTPSGGIGTATISVNSNTTSLNCSSESGKTINCVSINASYIILRGVNLQGSAEDAILLGPNAHHVVIEYCSITNWGCVGQGSNNQAAVRAKGSSDGSYDASNIKQIVVQRCTIYDPRDPGSGWDTGSTHPLGSNAVNFGNSGGNHVIRYNTCYCTISGHKFMDCIGGSDNFTTEGFPGADSDIYSNQVSEVFDDAYEIEGSGCNIRIWGNWMSNSFTGVSSATCSVGPLYIWRNVSNVGQRLNQPSFLPTPSQNDNEDRGPFNKTGSQDASVRGGRVFLFHNTMLQPTQSGFSHTRGLEGAIIDSGGPVTNVISRNNIWTSGYTGQGGYPYNLFQGSPTGQNCNFDYDLMNVSPGSTGSATLGTHRVVATPAYQVSMSISSTPNPSGYFLTSSSRGVNEGQVLNNFNDGFTGAAPDIGAYETGLPPLEFGINAYLATTTGYHFYKTATSISPYSLGLAAPSGENSGMCILEIRDNQ